MSLVWKTDNIEDYTQGGHEDPQIKERQDVAMTMRTDPSPDAINIDSEYDGTPPACITRENNENMFAQKVFQSCKPNKLAGDLTENSPGNENEQLGDREDDYVGKELQADEYSQLVEDRTERRQSENPEHLQDPEDNFVQKEFQVQERGNLAENWTTNVSKEKETNQVHTHTACDLNSDLSQTGHEHVDKTVSIPADALELYEPNSEASVSPTDRAVNVRKQHSPVSTGKDCSCSQSSGSNVLSRCIPEEHTAGGENDSVPPGDIITAESNCCAMERVRRKHKRMNPFCTPRRKRRKISHPPKRPFTCETCSVSFTQEPFLERHMLKHTAEKPFMCEVCHISFTSCDHLKQHLRTHLKSHPFVCAWCLSVFTHGNDLGHHIQLHAAEKPSARSKARSGSNNRATDPKNISSGRRSSVTHSTSLYSPNGPLELSIESNTSSSRRKIGPKPFGCRKDVITRHRRNRSNTCSTEQSAASSSAWSSHKVLDSSLAQKETVTVPIEPVVFSDPVGPRSKISLSDDSESAGFPFMEYHVGDKYCSNDFRPDVDMKGERKRLEKVHLCKQCSESFSEESELASHMRVHVVEKRFVCDVCGSSFGRNYSLKIHLLAHVRSTSHFCEMCSISFKRNKQLENHMKTHAGEQLGGFKIKSRSRSSSAKSQDDLVVCPKPSSSNQEQVDGLHKVPKRHCDFESVLCSASFTQPASVERHNLSHTGERPYVCEVCDSRFARLDSLKQHLRRHIRKFRSVPRAVRPSPPSRP